MSGKEKSSEDKLVKYSNIDYNEYFNKTSLNGTPLQLFTLGTLNLPTGSIIACDPLVALYDTRPFNRMVTAGKYPITACIAKTEESGDRYAAVKLSFSDKQAMKWELAVTDNQDISKLEGDEFYGYGVDAGLGCFCDVDAQKFYNEFADEVFRTSSSIYEDVLAPAFKKNAVNQNDPHDISDWLNFELPNNPGLNIIMFHSGYGDGAYPCYWGVDENGEIGCIVVDFMVL